MAFHGVVSIWFQHKISNYKNIDTKQNSIFQGQFFDVSISNIYFHKWIDYLMKFECPVHLFLICKIANHSYIYHAVKTMTSTLATSKRGLLFAGDALMGSSQS